MVKHTWRSSIYSLCHLIWIATSAPNKNPLRVKITFALMPQAATHTHSLVAAERSGRHQWKRDYWSIKLRGLLLEAEKACISSWAADKETLICPAQHNIAYPDILIRLNLDCDEVEESKKERGGFFTEQIVPVMSMCRHCGVHSVGSSGGGWPRVMMTFWGTHII